MNLQPRILYPARLSFRFDGAIKSFATKQKLREVSTTKPVQFNRSVMSYFLRPHGLQHARLLCQWDSPGKNTGVGCHFLLHLAYSRPSIYTISWNATNIRREVFMKILSLERYVIKCWISHRLQIMKSAYKLDFRNGTVTEDFFWKWFILSRILLNIF